MKYVRNFESYKLSKVEKPLNEEFLFGLIGKLFGKIKERINKTKGGKELETVYQKWLKHNIKDIQEKHVTIKSEEKGEFEIEPNNFNDGNMRYEISRLQSK